MDDILEDIKIIGTITGVPGKALALINKLKAERKQVEEGLAPFLDQPKKRVLFLLSVEDDSQPGWAPGQNAWVTNLIESSHAINVASELGKSWGEVSFEALLALNPEVLLIREAETPADQARMEKVVASLPSHPVWSQVAAIRNNRVQWIPNGPLSIPGPRVMQAYSQIAKAIWE
jgi:iron complex transport system substrate-binding protein